MGIYESFPEWENIIPIPQDDGGPNPLAAIAYTDEYSEAMSYLRAVMAKDEKSERVLLLTEHVITMNPAHYTVWLYRADTLKALNSDLLKELEWLNKISLIHLKNYQIWHHRQTLLTLLPSLPASELPFLATMFSKDVKNYHVWSYRAWLVSHFQLWASSPTSIELAYVESLLRADVRNNSAWNHRFFVVFGRDGGKGEIGEDVWEREIEFAKGKILEAPQNAAGWNYLRGVVRKKGDPASTKILEDFAARFVDLGERERAVGAAEGAEEGREGGGVEVASSHALDVLAEEWGKRAGEKEKALRALGLLAEVYDPIRKNYWDYRRRSLEVGKA